MAPRGRIDVDPDEDSDVIMADFSTLTKGPTRRGRKPNKTTVATKTNAALELAQAAGFDENAPLPHFRGDLTDEQIEANVERYQYVTGKSQNDYLRDWLPRRVGQLHSLLEVEGRNNPGGQCEGCSITTGVWRCMDCHGHRMLCGTCLWSAHRFLPFHRVEKWNETYFQEGSLWEVGIQIYLGHKGELCPRYRASAEDNVDGDGGNEAAELDDPYNNNSVGDPDLPDEDQAADGDEDEGVYDEAEAAGSQGAPKPPTVDSSGNPFISIVDVTGIHYLPVVACRCGGASVDNNLDYIRLGLYPTSFTRVKTVFTEAVLRDYRLSNLECKTSAYQYYQKLRRITAPAFPKSVLNRYRELRRLSRQYRNMKLWMMHGKIYDETSEENPGAASADDPPQRTDDWGSPAAGAETAAPAPASRDQRGTLALFCAACPQPGINLPDDWKDDPNRKLYTRSLVADGNFKADQLNPKNADDDVHLTNGEAFMTAPARYEEHLKEAEMLAPQYKSKPTCHNHHANADADKSVVGKRVRGVGAHACARHGCFCPSSVVDFTKGEKQMHMDWSLVEAIATTHMDEIVRLLHIYDVNCQYAKYLQRRIADSGHMSIPDLLEIVSAIGLFHVHGHKDECLYRYASTYIPGVGMVDGEILETLWAVLNLVSPSTRGATVAHRTEVLDDHMGDSNWKKIINTAFSIGKRYLRAVAQEIETQDYLDDVEASVPEHLRRRWARDIEAAEQARDGDVTVMDMMQSKNKKSPSRKDIELMLGNQELLQPGRTGSAAWIAEGLQLEMEQLEIREYVRKIGRRPTRAQNLELLKHRRSIRRKMEKYLTTAADFLDAETLHHLSNNEAVIIDVDTFPGDLPDAENPNITRADPERQKLPFPSAVAQDFRATLSEQNVARLRRFMDVEVQVRIGQANDCLEAIRNDLIQLSWQYKNEVRVNRSQNTKTKAWAGVNLLTKHWQMQRILYHINRFAMIDADGEELVSQKFPFLNTSDCVTSTVLHAPNVRGHTTQRRNWLWAGVGSLEGNLETNDYALEFWRVNWLTARAIHNRWSEEIVLSLKEMDWTVRYYSYMAAQWQVRQRSSSSLSEGHSAYAAKKVHMWNQLERAAHEHFDKIKFRGANYVPAPPV